MVEWQTIITAQGQECWEKADENELFVEKIVAQIEHPRNPAHVIAHLNFKSQQYNSIKLKNVKGMPDTMGALCTALFAFDEIDPSLPLLVAPGNFYINKDLTAICTASFEDDSAKAFSFTFDSDDPRLSYVRFDKESRIVEYCEKIIVSNKATTGIFGFSKAEDFYQAASWALVNNINRNGKFYISAAMNYFLSLGENIKNIDLKIDAKDFKKNWS
jgi:hypothetical protein